MFTDVERIHFLILVVCVGLVVLINYPRKPKVTEHKILIHSDEKLGIQYAITLLDQIAVKTKIGLNGLTMNIPHEAASSNIFATTVSDISKYYIIDTKISEQYLTLTINLKRHGNN